MNYKSVEDCLNYTSAKSAETIEMEIQQYLPSLANLPQVRSKMVDEKTAKDWLRAVVMNVPTPYIKYLLLNAKGFQPEEIAALHRFDNKEYNPDLHASEVYSAKNLLSVNLKGIYNPRTGNQFDADSQHALIVSRTFVKNQIGNINDTKLITGLNNNELHGVDWGLAKPDFIVTKSDENNTANLIYNIRTDLHDYRNEKTAEQTEEDLLRLNVQAELLKGIVGGNRPIGLSQLVYCENRDKVRTQRETMNALGFKKDNLNMAYQNLVANSNVPIKLFQVPLEPTLGKELLKSGNHHWENIVKKGYEPEFKRSVVVTTPPDVLAQRNEMTEQLFIIRRMQDRISDMNHDLTSKIDKIDLMYKIETDGQYVSKLMRRTFHQKLDYLALSNELAARNVPKHAYTDPVYDLENMLKAAPNGFTPSDYATYPEISKNRPKLESAAISRGINVENFMELKSKQFQQSPDTKGPIAKIKQIVDENINAIIPEVVADLQNTPGLKSETVYGKDPMRKEQTAPQANTQEVDINSTTSNRPARKQNAPTI